MFWIELIGYCGTGLTIVACAMKASVHLRVAGILSSLAFLIYGYLIASYPVMFMEMIFLPLNNFRLAETLYFERIARLPQAAAPATGCCKLCGR